MHNKCSVSVIYSYYPSTWKSTALTGNVKQTFVSMLLHSGSELTLIPEDPEYQSRLLVRERIYGFRLKWNVDSLEVGLGGPWITNKYKLRSWRTDILNHRAPHDSFLIHRVKNKGLSNKWNTLEHVSLPQYSTKSHTAILSTSQCGNTSEDLKWMGGDFYSTTI